METAWGEFTPAASSAGGLMIGLAAFFFMLLNGCVIGMIGILSSLLVNLPDWTWRLTFVISVIVGLFIVMAVTCAPIQRQTVMSGPFVYAVAFLVGSGTVVG